MYPRLSLLICDDDPDEPLFFEFALQGLVANVDIRYVSSGEELIDYLASAACFPDIIFLDNAIPGMSGVACLPEILALCPPSTAVVMHSCGAGQEDIDAAFEAGASRYMIKEVRPNDFRSALMKVVAAERSDLLVRDSSNFCVRGRSIRDVA